MTYNKNPCKECLLRPICNKTCDELISFVKKEIEKLTGEYIDNLSRLLNILNNYRTNKWEKRGIIYTYTTNNDNRVIYIYIYILNGIIEIENWDSFKYNKQIKNPFYLSL